MRRVILLTSAIAVVLAGCSSGRFYGDICGPGQDPKRDKCRTASTSLPSTKSPSPTQTGTVSVKPSASVKPTVRTCQYRGRTYPIVIRNQFDKYEPDTKRIFQGDSIKFTNLDKTHKHSMTEGDKQKPRPAFDSGPLAYNQSKVMKMSIPKGLYQWHDSEVPYILGGPLEILRPELPGC